MKKRTMKGLAERVSGVCCEVMRGPWERLIRELGVKDEALKRWPTEYIRLFAFIDPDDNLCLRRDVPEGYTLISFDSFLAKLKDNAEAPEPSAPAEVFHRLLNGYVNHRQPARPVNCGDVIYLGLSKKEHFCLAMGVPETGDPELDDIIRKGERKRMAGLAMQGLLTNYVQTGMFGNHESYPMVEAAAIRSIDQLLAELEKTDTGK